MALANPLDRKSYFLITIIGIMKINHLNKLLPVLFLFSFHSNAQEIFRSSIAMGSGANVASFCDRDDESYTGFNSTFVYQKMWVKWLGYRTGFNYDQKGNREFAPFTTGQAPFSDKYVPQRGQTGDIMERWIKTQYITIPYSLEFNINIKKSGIHGFGGVYTSVLVSQSFQYGVKDADDYETAENMELFHPIDAGVTFGAGSSYAFTPRLKTRAEAVFYYGLIPTSKGKPLGFFTKTVAAQATFVYTFNTKKDKEKLAKRADKKSEEGK